MTTPPRDRGDGTPTAPGRPGTDPTTPEESPVNGAARPADLSDLSRTDALLDRLGGGTLGDDDLDDPAVAVLAELLAVVDDPADDGEVGRLVEVLGGRPLYLLGADEEAPPTEDEAPIRLGPPEPRMIDLTSPETTPAGIPVAAGSAEAADGVAAATVLTPRRPWSWEKVLQQVSLPAASVLVLLVLGGGVSAVVTGDPMAPVNGVTRVVSQLPGVDKGSRGDRTPIISRAVQELRAANQAAAHHDKLGAAHHLAAARQAMAGLPEADKSELAAYAAQVQTQIETGVPPTVAPPSDPGSGSGPAPGSGAGSGTGPVTGGNGGGGGAATTPPVVVEPPATVPPTNDPPPATVPETTPPETTPPTTTTTTDPVPETSTPSADPSPSDSASLSAATEESTPAAT